MSVCESVHILDCVGLGSGSEHCLNWPPLCRSGGGLHLLLSTTDSAIPAIWSEKKVASLPHRQAQSSDDGISGLMDVKGLRCERPPAEQVTGFLGQRFWVY